jgi:hypothetical protein
MDFLKEVARLLCRRGVFKEDVVDAAAVGLIKYGMQTKEDLINVADSQEAFCIALELKGILPAIFDKLYCSCSLMFARTNGRRSHPRR